MFTIPEDGPEDCPTRERTLVPNVASIRPAQWNSCGPDPAHCGQAFYCSNESRPYCHMRNAEGLPIRQCLADASVSDEGNQFDYSAWQATGGECFKDLNQFTYGSFMMELKLFTFEFIQKSQKYTDFRNSLNLVIAEMNASVTVRNLELTYGGA